VIEYLIHAKEWPGDIPVLLFIIEASDQYPTKIAILNTAAKTDVYSAIVKEQLPGFGCSWVGFPVPFFVEDILIIIVELDLGKPILFFAAFDAIVLNNLFGQ
jgi:hypothetical protein